MAGPWIDLRQLKSSLAGFFNQQQKSISIFGSTVNQTFEASVFASVLGWYRTRGWKVTVENPMDMETAKPVFRLKFSTRGRPAGYSYAKCVSDQTEIHIRHQLRVATRAYKLGQKTPANVCMDVAIILPADVTYYTTNTAVPNDHLLTFAEAKHMSAFAELVAGFIGLVHEVQPDRLGRIRTKKWSASSPTHPAPFLYVSGILYHTAQGMKETIERRRYDIDIYTQTASLPGAPPLPATIK